MKILILADVHSNWPALEAVAEAESFDACFFAGDLVDYGTDPAPCIEWCRQHATAAVRGNHDHAVAQRQPARGGGGFKRLAAATRPLHWELVSPRRLKYLGRLPVTKHYRIERPGETPVTALLVHGTPRDPLDEYLRDDPAGWSERLSGCGADLVCVGHTHEAMVLNVEADGPDGPRPVTVLNPGSVGQPRDGRPGAAYAVWEDGKIELRRVAYDVDKTLSQMRGVGAEEWVVELTDQLLRTGGGLKKEEMDAIT